MEVFFQGTSHPHHSVLPFVAVDPEGGWGVWYSDDRQEFSFGPYFGARPSDPLASLRGMRIFDAFLAKSRHCSEALAMAAWELGYSADAAGPVVDEIRAVLSNDEIAALRNKNLPSLDSSLLYVVENDLPISMGSIYEAVTDGFLESSPLIEGCCCGAFLLVHGRLTQQFRQALGAVQAGRSGGSEPIVRDYIARADAMFANHLVTLERSFSKINKMLPGSEAASASTKQEGGLIQTITAKFRRSDVMTTGNTQASKVRKEIGMDRIACGEALNAIHQNFSNQHPYADMKMPNYHKGLTRFAAGLMGFSDKLADYLATHDLADDVREQTSEVRHNLDELRTWLNMTVREEMPGVYELPM